MLKKETIQHNLGGGGGDLVKGKEVILEQHDCMLHWLFTLMNKYIMKIILKFRARAKFKLDIVYH